jgi:hypothetical protein
MKKFKISTRNKSQQIINLGASISNFNYATTKATNNGIIDTYHLPVITRYGASYELSYGNINLIDSVSLIKVLVQSEYQFLLNSEYRSGLKFGGEVMFLNLVSLRGGWYNEKVDDFGFPNANKDKIEAITYGAGLHIPIHSFTKLPFDIQFDYTSLPQVSYSNINTNWTNFTTYSTSLKFHFK